MLESIVCVCDEGIYNTPAHYRHSQCRYEQYNLVQFIVHKFTFTEELQLRRMLLL